MPKYKYCYSNTIFNKTLLCKTMLSNDNCSFRFTCRGSDLIIMRLNRLLIQN